MMYTMIAVMLAAYLIGSIPFGYLIGRAKGVDIRTAGSCNIGATNVTRVIGPWYGKLCFLLDFLKGALPVLLVRLIFRDVPDAGFLPLAAGAGAILGHIFTLYLKFRGGKGISTAAGVIAALEPMSFIIVMAVWAVVFLTTRYVSLASVTAAVVLPVTALLFRWSGASLLPVSYYTVVFFALVAAIAVYKHRGNLKRLREGTEPRFVKKNRK